MRRLVRLCSRAYPGEDRLVACSLAEELIDGGASELREAAGLLRGGLMARVRVAGLPWAAALGRLGLPLAGLMLAALLLGIAQFQREPAWPGWFWAGGLAGALAAVLGLGLGRRRLALAGALAVAATCAADGVRDLYGTGARWTALDLDVLPALLPVAIVVALAAIQRRPRDVRGLAWALAGGAALVVVALAVRHQVGLGTTVLVAAGALAVVLALHGLVDERSGRLAAAVALAAAAPAVVWGIVAALGPRVSDAVAQLLLLGLAVGSAALVVALARRATVRRV